MLGLVVGVVLAVVPATVRNYVAARDFVLVSSNAAINLYIGNNADADGVTARVPDVQQLTGTDASRGWSWFNYGTIVRSVEAELGRPLKHSEVSSYFVRKALAYFRDHPGRCLQLAGKRALLFWGPAEVSNNKVIHYERRNSAILRYLPGFPLAWSAALLGLLLLVLELRSRRGWSAAQPADVAARFECSLLIVVFCAVYVASFLPFLAAGRFRVPVVPFLLVFGGYGVYRLGALLVGRELKRAAVWGVVALALYGFARIPLVPYVPSLLEWHVSRAVASSRAGDVEQAMTSYREAIKVRPDCAEAHQALAELLDKEGRLDEAIGEYRTAANLRPDNADLHYNLSVALGKRGLYGEAETQCREAIRLEPEHVAAHVNLGILLARRGQTEAAAAEYSLALGLDASHAEANYNLANLLAAQGNVDQAIARFRTALEAKPDYVEARINLGIALTNKGEYEAAIAEYRRALEIAPDSFEAHYNLAVALASDGQTGPAIAAIRDALRIRPDSQPARQVLHTLQQQQGKTQGD